MEITGIIAEYNPLHQGHLHHIEQTKQLLKPDVLIVLVSSWFSQRALPSLLTPADKARLALEAGADLVIELPPVYAAQSADQFAKYSIEALKTAGCTSICFGSETNDIGLLRAYSVALETMEKDPSTSYARSLEKQLAALKANDILGIQYIKYCDQFGITPYCIKRDQNFKSATSTRADFFDPQKPRQYLEEYFQKEQNWENYYPYLRLFLQMSDPKDLEKYFLVREGIEHRLIRLAKEKKTWHEFLEAAITKTYTRARIQRTCLFMMLQITKEQMERHDSFFAIKVLGANNRGRSWLNMLPVGTPIYSRFRQQPEFLQQVEVKSRALYNSVMENPVKDSIVMVP